MRLDHRAPNHLVHVFGGADGEPVLLTTASDEPGAILPPFELELDVRRLWTSPKAE